MPTAFMTTYWSRSRGLCSRALILALSLLVLAAAAATTAATIVVMPGSEPPPDEPQDSHHYGPAEEVPELYIEEADYVPVGAEHPDLAASAAAAGAAAAEAQPQQRHGADADTVMRQLPDCSVIDRLRIEREGQPVPDLVLVSTLNGHVTAIDSSGQIVWWTDTGPPLLQASLKKLTLDDGRGGQATYIPSLDGSLYRFDGKHVEVVADANSLLYSSLKTDRWVFSGKRETNQLGIDARTGQVRYVCNGDGCTNLTGSENQVNGNQKAPEGTNGAGRTDRASDDSDGAVLVIRRNTQTVRAVEPRSGKEEWHFTVGENSLRFIEDVATGCNPKRESKPRVTLEGDDEVDGGSHLETGLRVETSTGKISGTHQSHNWTLALGSPIVGAWQLSADGLEEVDLFEPSRLMGMEHGSQPIFYVGVYQQQLYLQQNSRYVSNNMLTSQWYNQQHSFGAIGSENRPMIDYNPGINLPQVSMEIDEDGQIADEPTALVPFSPRDIFEQIDCDTGYYFMQEERDGDCKRPAILPNIAAKPDDSAGDDKQLRVDRDTGGNIWPDEDHDDAPIIYVVHSLWNYWKEITFISIILSVAVNLIITQILPRVLERNRQQAIAASSAVKRSLSEASEPLGEGSPSTPSTTEGSSSKTVTASDDTQITAVDYSSSLKRSESGESTSTVATNYISRYATDFEPVRCLGKGGFGIVFESRNKIDDCSYAVKRIRLPARKGAREKVLREVKALAKLDHQHIVRYYNAWLETPPPGWQQEMDAAWKATLPVSTTNALSIGAESTPAETGATTAYGSSELTGATGKQQRNGGDADDLRKRIDGFNPLRPFDFDLNSWQTSQGGHQENNLDMTQGGTSYSGSWADDGVSRAGDEDDSNDEPGCEDEISMDGRADDANRLGVEDSIVFASDDKGSGTRSDTTITKRSKSETENDGHISRVASDDEIESSSKDNVSRSSKNGNDNKITQRKRPDSLPVPVDGVVDADGASPRPTIYLYIQIELCRKESLKDWLAQRKTLDERGHDKVLEIFYQIICAVEYVHDSGLIHRDLKPSNIFFATVGDVVKVGDFGLVTGTEGMASITSIPVGTPGAHGDQQYDSIEADILPSDIQLTDKVGTQLYMSHEQVAGSKYNQKVDIFALGLILFELLWSLPTQMERVRTLSAVKQLRFPKGFKKEFRDEYQLVRTMLAADPNLRPTAQEVLRHSLFNEIRQNSAKRQRRRTNSSRNSHSSHDGPTPVPNPR